MLFRSPSVVQARRTTDGSDGTELDPVLRNLGIRTIVAAGVSVNVALTNLVFDGVNVGYQVVVPRDAVAGLPAA